MLKLNLKDLYSKIKTGWHKINWQKLPHFNWQKVSLFAGKICLFITSWWHVLLLSLLVFIFLYYPLGGLIINKVDKTSDYEINNSNLQQSATVEMTSFLINREVNQNLWTPNLPFFFPSYLLDNMPNFQLGMVAGLSTVTNAMANRLDSAISQGTEELHLKNAAKLLKYDGKTWMFSAHSNFSPVPSAHSQYRKARQQLIKFNQNLSSGQTAFYKSPADLAYFLTKINKDLSSSLGKIETQIREASTNFTDSKADDVFYYNQGKLYSYYHLLKALGHDYKEVIVDKNAYQLWTRAIKSAEDGSTLDAFYIRNGELSGITSPNHLQYLAYYIIKTINLNKSIIALLEKNNTAKE